MGRTFQAGEQHVRGLPPSRISVKLEGRRWGNKVEYWTGPGVRGLGNAPRNLGFC